MAYRKEYKEALSLLAKASEAVVSRDMVDQSSSGAVRLNFIPEGISSRLISILFPRMRVSLWKTNFYRLASNVRNGGTSSVASFILTF